jgi:hypothetical protein
VKMAAQFGFHKIHLETDCLELIQLWEKREMQRFIITPILLKINEFRLASSEFVFTFASRSCSRVAHVSQTSQKTHRSELWHVTPACVCDLVVYMKLRNDMNRGKFIAKKHNIQYGPYA